MLLGFAVTAVVASGIVIANTFTILITQRRRHIALTRCIGGSRGQVRREVLAEASLVGAIGAAIGVGGRHRDRCDGCPAGRVWMLPARSYRRCRWC